MRIGLNVTQLWAARVSSPQACHVALVGPPAPLAPPFHRTALPMLVVIRTFTRRFTPLLLPLGIAAAGLRAQGPAASDPPRAMAGSVSGRVTDAQGGLPIVGVGVTIEGTQLGANTGEDGRYT